MTKTLLVIMLLVAVAVMAGCAESYDMGNGTIITKDGRTFTGQIWNDPDVGTRGQCFSMFVPNGKMWFKYEEIASIKLEGKK